MFVGSLIGKVSILNMYVNLAEPTSQSWVELNFDVDSTREERLREWGN